MDAEVFEHRDSVLVAKGEAQRALAERLFRPNGFRIPERAVPELFDLGNRLARSRSSEAANRPRPHSDTPDLHTRCNPSTRAAIRYMSRTIIGRG